MGDLVFMPLVKPLDREVHLLVSLEARGELHAPSGRMVHEREPTRLLRLRTLDALEPLAHRPLSLLKLLDALVHELDLAPDQAHRALDRLVVDVVLDLLHGDVEPAELLDERDTAHVLERVGPVAVDLAPRAQDPDALVIPQRIYPDTEKLRDLPDSIASLRPFAHRHHLSIKGA